MRTRSFIGLILLVAMLIVAATPALLAQSAEGIERGLVKAGAIDDVQARLDDEREQAERRAEEDPAEPQLLLKGHELDRESGDLRDTISSTERGANQRGRLEAGNARIGLPGELVDAAALPAVTTEDGLLLDRTGCPTFAAGDDPAALLAIEELRERYVQRAEAADDPAACATRLTAFANGTLEPEQEIRPNSPIGRQVAELERRSLHSLVISISEFALLAEMTDSEELAAAMAAVE